MNEIIFVVHSGGCREPAPAGRQTASTSFSIAWIRGGRSRGIGREHAFTQAYFKKRFQTQLHKENENENEHGYSQKK